MDMKLYKIGTYVALRYWETYKDEFLKACIDKDDLIQESNIVVHKAIEKWNKKKCSTLKMYIETKVSSKIIDIKRTKCEQSNKINEAIDNKKEILKNISEEEHRFLFADLKTILKEEDYRLIEERFIYKKNLDVVGKMFGIGKTGVIYRLNRIFAQCKIIL